MTQLSMHLYVTSNTQYKSVCFFYILWQVLKYDKVCETVLSLG